jgi:hypothetical protein
MGIEHEGAEDLSLAAQDAENVTGGRALRKKLKNLTHKVPVVGTPLSNVVPTTYSGEPDVDPVADEEGV